MDRWSVTCRLPGAATDRIEIEAINALSALAAAKRLLPESAEIVGYRLNRGSPDTWAEYSITAPAPEDYFEGHVGRPNLALLIGESALRFSEGRVRSPRPGASTAWAGFDRRRTLWAASSRHARLSTDSARAESIHGESAAVVMPLAGERCSRCAMKHPRSRQLSTRSLGKPPLRAISTPQCVRSISAIEWASGLMLIQHPSSTARRCQRQSRSRRHGLALISTATPCAAHAARIFSMSKS
jgi:hypothetical protein